MMNKMKTASIYLASDYINMSWYSLRIFNQHGQTSFKMHNVVTFSHYLFKTIGLRHSFTLHRAEIHIP